MKKDWAAYFASNMCIFGRVKQRQKVWMWVNQVMLATKGHIQKKKKLARGKTNTHTMNYGIF